MTWSKSMNSKSEGRLLWLFLFVIVVLAVCALNSGCATVAGIGRDMQAAAEGVAVACKPSR